MIFKLLVLAVLVDHTRATARNRRAAGNRADPAGLWDDSQYHDYQANLREARALLRDRSRSYMTLYQSGASDTVVGTVGPRRFTKDTKSSRCPGSGGRQTPAGGSTTTDSSSRFTLLATRPECSQRDGSMAF